VCFEPRVTQTASIDMVQSMANLTRPRSLRSPFVVTKMGQLLRVVRESHEIPMTGVSRPPERVPADELGVTFIGHSSFLLQIGGKNILIDPVLSKRLIVLRRLRRPGVAAEQMPPIDLVLVTHAHMDHLDIASLRHVIRNTVRLAGRTPDVVVPNGVEDLVSHLRFARVHRMEWWQRLHLKGLEITMTPCRHWGARMFNDTHRGYGGYVIEGGGHSVYHSGDTAYFSGFVEIGRRLNPQVALLPIGAYFPDSYRAVHTSPEEAIQAFRDLGAESMVPMHFGTFRLGREPMHEPVERLRAEARRLGITDRVRVLGEGETMRVSASVGIL
jgi:L-ascorbate metabolism protein UlaG (beta-lactamase superfamily)